MKTLTVLLTSFFMIIVSQALFAYTGQFKTDTVMSEQEAISAVKMILPNVANGTDASAVSVAQDTCGNYNKATFNNPTAQINTVWRESDGQLKQGFFAHVRFGINCLGSESDR